MSEEVQNVEENEYIEVFHPTTSPSQELLERLYMYNILFVNG